MRATMASAESDFNNAAAHNLIADNVWSLDIDGTTGVLDAADALGFVEVQQQEVTVEPVVDGDPA
jgi:hypothetical protein